MTETTNANRPETFKKEKTSISKDYETSSKCVTYSWLEMEKKEKKEQKEMFETIMTENFPQINITY